jgi:hypothetical protein
MRRSVRFALLAAATSLAACSANPLGPSNGACRKSDSCSSRDFVNPNADFVNPNADFINPNADFVNPNASVIPTIEQ